MHPLTHRVLEYVRRAELLRPGDRVGIAVSGGADSVALLRILLELRHELGLVLSVLHFNHQLRGAASDADEVFVAELARAYKLEIRPCTANVGQYAVEKRISIETAARELRREFFGTLLAADPGLRDKASGSQKSRPLLDKVATGHTLDDQAETVLMRVIRGTGGRGLGGIHPRFEFPRGAGDVAGAIVRPLLAVRRRELEQYLNQIGQAWREDASNREVKFTRNRVRHVLLPLVEREFNPAIADGLSELAEIARGEEDFWENQAAAWTGAAVQWFTSVPGARAHGVVEGNAASAGAPATGERGQNERPRNASVNRMWLLAEPLALQRRLVKSIGEQAGVAFDFKHVEEILRFAGQGGADGKELALPKGCKLVLQGESLLFVAPEADVAVSEPGVDGYEHRLTVPGFIEVAEIGSRFELALVARGIGGYAADDLLDFSLLSNPVTVRNWRAGDRFWPAHRKCERKVKELLAELNMPPSERKLWPVIVSGSEIVWMRGFPVGAKFKARGNEHDRVFVRETAIH